MNLNPPNSHAERMRIEGELHQYAQERVKEGVDKSVARLFPSLKPGELASPRAINDLKSRFHASVKQLQDERHAIAHRYESDKPQRLPANLDRLQASFVTIEQILSDLRLVALGSHFIFSVPSMSHRKRVAQDLVDQVLIGDINRVVAAMGMNREEGELRYYWQFRKRYQSAQRPEGAEQEREQGSGQRTPKMPESGVTNRGRTSFAERLRSGRKKKSNGGAR